MSIGDILYKLLIGPLELFFEVVFMIANRLVENPAYAIIVLSLAMNILVLPLYRRADEMQAEERDKENALKPWVTHIKKTFKGDERFMMLQAFYRQNDYKPTDTLKGSISLLLEIPFFIAAFHFLSHLAILAGVSFGPIKDLGAPDALLSVGGLSINILPILMTLINFVSAAIYMKGFPLKSKVQMYGIAVIFLIFLYRSPAGLVFYWTLNNLFSLFKNIFYKIKNPAKVLRVLLSLASLIFIGLILFVHPMRTPRAQALILVLLLTMQLPMLLHLAKRSGKTFTLPEQKYTKPLFYGSCALLTVLTGLLIPSAIIHESALEFVDTNAYLSPNWYLVSAAVIAVGTFILWFGIFFNIAGERGKQLLSLLVALAAVGGVVDYMFFGDTYGNMSTELIYDVAPSISRRMILINLAVLAGVALIVLLFWAKKRALITILIGASCAALFCMAGINIVGIQKNLSATDTIINAAEQHTPKVTLSKNGKNVIVIMMDRQIGHFVPFIMHEKPELKEQFDGFTLYVNSVSFGSNTNFGTPALYGGYDYTTERINERDTESLESKQNEALKVMPTLFDEAGYHITICEPTYAGYSWVPDLTVFDDHPDWDLFLAGYSQDMDQLDYKSEPLVLQQQRLRNFFCYSIFRISPSLMQQTLYAQGNYNSPQVALYPQVTFGYSKSSGYTERFLKCMADLYNLKDITTIEDSDTGCFYMMSNDLTHVPMILKEPEYQPALVVDNTEFDKAHPTREDGAGHQLQMQDETTVMHYQCNMAAMIQLGQWFDYLKENDIWDNTRIIIVSDHGYQLPESEAPYMLDYVSEHTGKPNAKDVLLFNSVLLVKDFDSTGFTINEEMSTNADVPAFATKDLIPNAANPFTGKPIKTYQEEPVELNLLLSSDFNIDENNGNRFFEAEWFNVHDNIYDINNWTYKGWH